jgi:hypothetical protein
MTDAKDCRFYFETKGFGRCTFVASPSALVDAIYEREKYKLQ